MSSQAKISTLPTITDRHPCILYDTTEVELYSPEPVVYPSLFYGFAVKFSTLSVNCVSGKKKLISLRRRRCVSAGLSTNSSCSSGSSRRRSMCCSWSVTSCSSTSGSWTASTGTTPRGGHSLSAPFAVLADCREKGMGQTYAPFPSAGARSLLFACKPRRELCFPKKTSSLLSFLFLH